MVRREEASWPTGSVIRKLKREVVSLGADT